MSKVRKNASVFYPKYYFISQKRFFSVSTNHCQIIVGTPKEMIAWSQNHALNFNAIKIAVFDEADLVTTTQAVVHGLLFKLPEHCQVLLFSATFNKACVKYIANPIIKRIPKDEEILPNTKHICVQCTSPMDKFKVLKEICDTFFMADDFPQRAIVFANDRQGAKWLMMAMSQQTNSVGLLTGDMPAKTRLEVLRKFHLGFVTILIASNHFSRGIDVDLVKIVINYDIPVDQFGKADCKSYLHRTGRGGRFGKFVLVLNLITTEQEKQLCSDICHNFDISMPLL